jgi:hypothetical protein
LGQLASCKDSRWGIFCYFWEKARKAAPHGEMQYKLELMPYEIKLDGVGSYLSWSRRGMLILRTKSMEGYVLGKVLEPKEKEEQEWKRWNATDSLVLTWLLNSLTPAIAASVEAHIKRGMGVLGQGKCHAGLSN